MVGIGFNRGIAVGREAVGGEPVGRHAVAVVGGLHDGGVADGVSSANRGIIVGTEDEGHQGAGDGERCRGLLRGPGSAGKGFVGGSGVYAEGIPRPEVEGVEGQLNANGIGGSDEGIEPEGGAAFALVVGAAVAFLRKTAGLAEDLPAV